MKLSVLLAIAALVGVSDAFQFFSKFKRAPKVDIAAEQEVADMFGDKSEFEVDSQWSSPIHVLVLHII